MQADGRVLRSRRRFCQQQKRCQTCARSQRAPRASVPPPAFVTNHHAACAGKWEGAQIAALVLPTAETLSELRALTEGASRQRLVLCINPQWFTAGQIVSDFGLGPARQRSEELVDAFLDVFHIAKVNVNGDRVTLMRVYPGTWQVHWASGRGSSAGTQLLALENERPEYSRLVEILQRQRGSRTSMSWLERLRSGITGGSAPRSPSPPGASGATAPQPGGGSPPARPGAVGAGGRAKEPGGGSTPARPGAGGAGGRAKNAANSASASAKPTGAVDGGAKGWAAYSWDDDILLGGDAAPRPSRGTSAATTTAAAAARVPAAANGTPAAANGAPAAAYRSGEATDRQLGEHAREAELLDLLQQLQAQTERAVAELERLRQSSASSAGTDTTAAAPGTGSRAVGASAQVPDAVASERTGSLREDSVLAATRSQPAAGSGADVRQDAADGAAGAGPLRGSRERRKERKRSASLVGPAAQRGAADAGSAGGAADGERDWDLEAGADANDVRLQSLDQFRKLFGGTFDSGD